jgi:hypothetical protein
MHIKLIENILEQYENKNYNEMCKLIKQYKFTADIECFFYDLEDYIILYKENNFNLFLEIIIRFFTINYFNNEFQKDPQSEFYINKNSYATAFESLLISLVKKQERINL